MTQKRSDEGSAPSTKKARYHLTMPVSLQEQLETLAKEQQVTMADLIRRFIKLGIIASKYGQSPDVNLCIAQGDKIQHLIVW